MFRQDLLKNKTVLVTGGGTGLGAAMATRFAELGANLVICGRRPEVLEKAAELMRAYGTQVHTRVCNVREPEAVEALIEDVWHAYAPDVLVNNAAATFIAETSTLSHRAVDTILGTTLHGALYCTLEMGKRWIEAGRPGVVLSILSTSTITGRAFTVPSAVAKSGLLAMTKSLAVEWGPKNIRTVAIAPGPFPTAGATRQLNPAERGGAASGAPRNPLGRVGRVDELADLASYLISDRSAYINGEMVVIDGGEHLRTSGVEDLLRWTPEQWGQLRASRAPAKNA